MTKKLFPKMLVTLILAFVFTFMLTGCSKGNAFPSEGIDLDKAYLSNSSITVTEGELYKTLKTKYGLDLLTKAINKVVFADQIATYNAHKGEAKYREFFEYYADEACYSTTDKEKIAEYDLTTKINLQKKFLDTLATYGVAVDYNQKLATGEYDIYQDCVADYYIVDIAVMIYADEVATKEFNGLIEFNEKGITDRYKEDELTDAIKAEIEKEQTDKIVAEYNKNYKNRGDMYGILIRFNDSIEYEEVLKSLCLKPSGGKWYQIPYEETDDFDKYYANYTVKPLTALTDVEVFANFIIMYNFINSYRSNIINDMGWSTASIDDIVASFKTTDRTLANQVLAAIKADAGNEDGTMKYGTTDEDGNFTRSEFISRLLEKDTNGDFTLEYDEYYTSYFSIYSHFFTTLKTTGQKFSTKGITYSNKITGSDGTFLGFKLEENKVVKLFDEETIPSTDSDGEESEETKYTFLDTEEAVALKNEIIQKIIDDEVYSLTANDYSKLVTARYEYDKLYSSKKIKIYDTDLQLLYSQKNSLYKKTGSTSNDAIAVVDGTKILAKDFAKELLNAYAPIVSLSSAFDKWIVQEYENGRFEQQITEKELKEQAENAFNYYMNQFVSGTDSLTGYSLPSTVGKKAFMSIAYGVTTMKEAVESYFKPLILKNLFYANLDGYYAEEGKDITDPYQILANYAKAEFEDYFSLTYQNLLIYIDMNGDEELEDPEEYIATLSTEKQAEFKKLICDFADEIKAKVQEGSTLTKGISAFATEYNKASRFDERWGKYKKAGLFIKLESSTTTTNTTGTSLVKPFYNRLVEVYNDPTNWDTVENYMVDGSFVPFFDHETGRNYENLLVTEFGYHLVLFTGAANKADASFDSDNSKYKNITYKYKNDKGDVYNTITIDDVLSSTAYPSRNQVEVYVRDYELYGSNLNLYTDTYNSVKSSLSNVYTRYTSSTHRTLLILEILIQDGFNFANAEDAKRADLTIEITKLQLDSYKEASENIYANWFEDFGYNSKFAK